jgi:hypothetical protein
MALVQCPECGREVSETAVSCPNCSYDVKKHFDDIENERIQRKKEAIKLQRKEKKLKTIKVIIPLIIIVISGIVAAAINTGILSSRKTFASEDEMLNYLAHDCESWKLDNDYKEEYLVFYDNNRCSLLTDGIFNGGEKIILHPKRGFFERNNEKYIILKSGDIVRSNKEDYYKPYYFNASFEDGYSVLHVDVSSYEIDNGQFRAEYKVTNNGLKNYYQIFLETVITLSDDSTIVLTDDFEYVSMDDDDMYLRPGKTGTAKAFGDNIPENVKSITFFVKSYETEYKFD